MELIIIGTGMYVSGRKTEGYGTILPSVIEYSRKYNNLTKITVVGTNVQRAIEAKNKFLELSHKTGVSLPISFMPEKSDSKQSYKNIIENLNKSSCVIVAVPDHLHYEIIKFVIERGHHCLVVKPLTPTLNEGKKLIEIQKKYNAYGVVEFHKRWDRQNRMLRDEFQSGKFGNPLYTWTEYSQRKSIPSYVFKSWVLKNNILQYLGVHYIDIIRFVTGASPRRVMAIGQKSWLKDNNLDVYDSIQCILEWETRSNIKFTQTLLVNWIDPENTSAMSDQNIKFVGSKGRFEGDQKNRGVLSVTDNKKIEHINPDFCRSYQTNNDKMIWEGYGVDSIKSFLNDVYQIINKGRTPKYFDDLRPTFAESLFSTAVIEAANISLNSSSKWQNIENI